MAAEIPAGWYPNPWNDAEELYWSGAEWTGISRAAHRVAPQQGMPVASDLEDSTIMRPVGTDAAVDAPPVVTPNGSMPGGVHPHAEQSYSTGPYGDQHAPELSYAPPSAPQQGPNTFGPPAYVPPATPSAYAPALYATPSAPAPYELPATSTPYEPPTTPSHYARLSTADVAPNDVIPHGVDAASIRWALSTGAPPKPAVNPQARFGVIAMIVGIVAAVFAVIPGLSFAAWVPAFVAVGLGIVGYLGGRPRALAVAGIITGGAALAAGTAVSIWFLVQLGVLRG